MADDWYCLVLGEELGPLSWSELAGMASRGSLGKQQRIKPSATAEWIAAESVAGLFDTPGEPVKQTRPPSHEAATARPWYCQMLGMDFGPLPWDELRGMIGRGMLRPSDRVRQEGEQEWRQAGQVEGLLDAMSTRDSTDFEIEDPALRKAAHDDADFEIAPWPVRASADATDFGRTAAGNEADVAADGKTAELSGPSQTRSDASPSAAGDARSVSAEPVAEVPPSTAANAGPAPPAAQAPRKGLFARLKRNAKPVEAPAPAPEKPAVAVPAMTESPAATEQPAAKPPPRQPKPASRKRERVGLSDQNKRALLGLLALLCLAALGYGGYLGVVALASMRRANYDEILAGYDQLYAQAKKAQTDPAMAINPQIGMQFISTLSRLRGPLQNAPPGSVDEKLNKAGTRLAELFSTAAAAAGTEQGKQRSEVEADYQSLMASIRGELGK